MKYRLYDYDLWGNEEEGLTVNQVFQTDTILEIDEETLNSDKKLIKLLKDEGIIKKYIHNSKITIDGEPDYTLYFNYNYNPSFELRREET